MTFKTNNGLNVLYFTFKELKHERFQHGGVKLMSTCIAVPWTTPCSAAAPRLSASRCLPARVSKCGGR